MAQAPAFTHPGISIGRAGLVGISPIVDSIEQWSEAVRESSWQSYAVKADHIIISTVRGSVRWAYDKALRAISESKLAGVGSSFTWHGVRTTTLHEKRTLLVSQVEVVSMSRTFRSR